MDRFTILVNQIIDDKFALIKYVVLYSILMLCFMGYVVATTLIVKVALIALFVAVSVEIRLFIENDYMKFGVFKNLTIKRMYQ